MLLSGLRADRVTAEALAASTVKVAARDVIGTWKVLISLGLAPVLYGFYAFLATVIMIKADAPFVWKVWTPFAVIAALPLIGFAALKFGEAGMDVLKYVFQLILANHGGADSDRIGLSGHLSSRLYPDSNDTWKK